MTWKLAAFRLSSIHFSNTMLPPMVIYQGKGLYRGWLDAGDDCGGQTAIFASGTHRFYPDAVPQPLFFFGKTRQAEARLRRIVNQYGVPLASARNLQAAIVQGTMLYASELTWNGQDKVEGPYQLAINRMARATLGTISQRRGASS